MNPFRLALWLLPGLATSLGTSCSNAGKPRDRGIPPFVAQVVGEPVLTDDAVQRLKAIADDPGSHLPPAPGSETPAPPPDGRELAGTGGVESPADAWRRHGFDPRVVAIGDVFSEHAGPLLNKAFSFADLLPPDRWQPLLESLAETRPARVPLTFTARDVAAMRELVGDPDIPLPSRSVALDLRLARETADEAALAEVLHRAHQGDPSFPAEVAPRLEETRARLQRGERLFIVTGVSRAESMRAHYPGSPLGNRDADAIRNAVALAYPHLDGLETKREGNAVAMERSPALYWEFDTRELALAPEGIAILPLAEEPSFLRRGLQAFRH